MIKKLIITLIISFVIVNGVKADWVPLSSRNNAKTPPKVTIIDEDEQSTTIKVDISGFDLNRINSTNSTYDKLDLLSDIFISKPGSPELPYIATVLAIPDKGGVSVEVLEMSETLVFKNINVSPVREVNVEGAPLNPFVQNKVLYESQEVFPVEYASVEPPSVFRDFRITRLSVYPVKYIPSKNEIHAVSSITIRIVYGEGEEINPKIASTKSISPSFGKLYRSFISNYQYVLDSRYNGEENGREVMLCIMPDDYVDDFQEFANWKTESGIFVHVTKFSDIGANAYNELIIYNHIYNAYYDWEFPPTYVLLVGDYNYFPVFFSELNISENSFVELEGDDFFPEMMVGRFTIENDYKLQVMTNKVVSYEKEPYTAENEWFEKAICCSNNDYNSQVITKRFTANVMLTDGGFTSVDTMMSDGNYSGQGCTYHLSDVTNAIEEGRSFLNYRGEGWSDGWDAACYDFHINDVSGLNNGEKLTFVTSIGCGVAAFDSYAGNCFGEEWVELGTPDAIRGGIAFIGPTGITHTTYNNRIDRGIYVGMFREGMDTPGQALLRGKLYMYNVFGTDPYVQYNYHVFCQLGDPSVRIWKKTPQEIDVDHLTVIPVGYNQLEITVTSADLGYPIANAEVCLYSDEIYITTVCDSLGVALIDFIPEIPQSITVTVYGDNVIPYQGTIDVLQGSEMVGPESYPVIIDIDGNTDGFVNPGEKCKITFNLKNWGTQTSSDVKATLSVVETDWAEVITTDPIEFGDIQPGESTISDSFMFQVFSECPVGQFVTLELHINSTTSSWEFHYPTEAQGCELVYHSFIVNDNDPLNLNQNYKLDPGETVMMYLSVQNVGVDVAPNVMGKLTSNDPYITIVDSWGSFSTVDTNEIECSYMNYFIVSADPMCPTNYYADYSLKLNTNEGNYPYSKIVDFQIPVSMPIPTDFTGPDEYGYYAYSEVDTIYEQAPVYEWIDISYVGEEIIVPDGSSNYTTTVELPFMFKYYGFYYTNLRISTDGWVAFGSGSQMQPVNHPIPHIDNANCMVAAFWDDLHEGINEQGKMYYHYDINNHEFVIEWKNIGHNQFSYNHPVERFQVKILSPLYYPTATGDGEIIVQYHTVEKAGSMTVGIEDDSQTIGLQYVCNSDYDPTASFIVDGSAIKFTTESPLMTVSVNDNEVPSKGPILMQNIPNPFKSSTTIYYYLPDETKVLVKIFNINGELVKTCNRGIQKSGNHSIVWDATNESGTPVDSGIYFYSLFTDSFVKTKKLLIVR
jgi:peptidase C25-like protein/flagellar hook capping protein FlgD